MKQTFRLSMTWLHRSSGLLFGWFLYVIALTGTIVVFSDEISVWMQPEIPASPTSTAQAVMTAERYLHGIAPRAESWSIGPFGQHGAIAVGWFGEDEGGSALLDARTGAGITARDTHGAEPLVDLHFRLHSGTLGMWVVAGSGMIMLAGLVTGVILHRRIFRDFFTFRPGKGQRSWLDAHNLAGVATLPFQIVIAFTGLMIFPVLLMPGPLLMRYDGDRDAYITDYYAPAARPETGQPATLTPLRPLLEKAEHLLDGKAAQVAVAHPGDAGAVVTVWRAADDRLSMMADWTAFDGTTGTILGSQTRYPAGTEASGALVGLHFAKFGGLWTRWLYFISGIASTAIVATGLLLWAIKRRSRPVTHDRGLWLVDRLNLAVIAGLPVGIAAYFAANRLLPPGLAERAECETRTLFLVWAGCLGWAVWRADRSAWKRMLLLAAGLLCVPIVVDLASGRVGSQMAISAVLAVSAAGVAAAAVRYGRVDVAS